MTQAAAKPSPTPEATRIIKMQAELKSAKDLVSQLESEVRRLQAALAVERANQTSKELQTARRDKHLFNYRMSRIMRVFDVLDLPRPNLNVEPLNFVNDAFLDDVQKRIRDTPAKPHLVVNLHHSSSNPNQTTRDNQPTRPRKRARPNLDTTESDDLQHAVDVALDAAQQASSAENDTDTRKQPQGKDGTSTAPASETAPPPSSAEHGNTHIGPRSAPSEPLAPGAQGTKEQHTSTSGQTASQRANGLQGREKRAGVGRDVDESNPAAECLRMLIGAEYVRVYDNPRRIRIKMFNRKTNRDATFSLRWADDQMECTHESHNMEESVCPDFLWVEKIEFDTTQAPNFLVLLLGAILDMKIEPKDEPEVAPDHPQQQPQDRT